MMWRRKLWYGSLKTEAGRYRESTGTISPKERKVGGCINRDENGSGSALISGSQENLLSLNSGSQKFKVEKTF